MDGEIPADWVPEKKPVPLVDSESIKIKILQAQGDINDWNRLNEAYKGAEAAGTLYAELPRTLEEFLPEIRIGELHIESNLLEQHDRDIDHALKPLKARGAIRRTSDEIPPEQMLPYTEFIAPINGLEEKPGLTRLIDQNLTRQEIAQNIPTYYRQGIESFDFIDNPEEEIEYHKLPNDPELAQKDTDLITKDIKHAVYHETFEHITKSLSLNDMRKWEDALRRDSAQGVNFITAYSMASSQLSSPEDGKREDFCESGAYFFVYPYELYTVAPNRFYAILDILSRHLPPAEREAYRRQAFYRVDKSKEEFRLKGISDEEIREEILAHQDIPAERINYDFYNNDLRLAGKYFNTALTPTEVRGKIEIYVLPYVKE